MLKRGKIASDIQVFAKSLTEKIPLGGVSETSWSTLFNAAKSFATSVVYKGKDFPNIEDGAKGVFCQQDLSDQAKERMVLFETHMSGALVKRKKEIEEAISKYENEIKISSVNLNRIGTTEEPWAIQKCSKRANDLFEAAQKLKKNLPPTDEEYNKQSGEIYGRVRETWERLVEEVVLAKVIERFSQEVKTQSLHSAYVCDEDYKAVHDNMTKHQ